MSAFRSAGRKNMLSRRKIKPVSEIDPALIRETPVPPKLKVKIKRVFLGPKHLREMKPIECDFKQAIHWIWENWVDEAGVEYASVKHGRYKLWYKVEPLVPEGGSVDTLKELEGGNSHLESSDGPRGDNQLLDERRVSPEGCGGDLSGTCGAS